MTLGKSLPGSNSKLGHLFAWAFFSIIFLPSKFIWLFIYTSILLFQKELLLRSKLSVVTLGKSLPGSNSKLGHSFAWASFTIIFLPSKFIWLFIYTSVLIFQKELLLRSKLSVVTLGKSLPGSNSKLGHLFAWAFFSIIFLPSKFI